MFREPHPAAGLRVGVAVLGLLVALVAPAVVPFAAGAAVEGRLLSVGPALPRLPSTSETAVLVGAVTVGFLLVVLVLVRAR